MNGHRRLAALFVMLALVWCAGGNQAGTSAVCTLSQKAKRDMHDGGDGGM
jgi:hypothetical protein